MNALDLMAVGFAVCEVAPPELDGSCSCRLRWDCPSPGKHPTGRKWLARAITNRERRPWWLPPCARLTPISSYGLIPVPGSGMIVIDRDDPTADLPIPNTFTVTRASAPEGRGHYYLRLADGIDEADVPRVFAGGEVRVAGSGHVVGPGSRHVSGDTYEANDEPIAEASEALLGALRARPPVRRDGTSPADSGDVGEGERHPWLVGQARKMAGWGWDAERIIEELRMLNETMCTPPLTDRVAEFDRMAEWAVQNIAPDRGFVITKRSKRERRGWAR